MGDILSSGLDTFDQWQQANLHQLGLFESWLRGHDLVNEQAGNLLTEMRLRLQSHQLNVAFVAEFSRGKSELINAIFFAGSGKRIMPASVGRTTMCPVEIGYDKSRPPCIRLLPLETRKQPMTLTEWRYGHDEAWEQRALDIDNMDNLAEAMNAVSERRFVTPKEAAELGLWEEDNPQNNPSVNALGLVEIPMWRHAVVNYPHPLLKRGIAILDTPGLNTVGVEPELTLELLPQAHALFFILAADTGVTRSDLQIWKDYLNVPSMAERPCYVLLNKIDVLWDGLLTSEQAKAQLQQQRETCAALLNVPMSRVLGVSAQKGLLGKIKNNFDLLQQSRLPLIERLLVRDLLPERKQILQNVLASHIEELLTGVNERLVNRLQLLSSQMAELRKLQGENTGLIEEVEVNITQRNTELEALRKRASELRHGQKRKIKQIQKMMSHESVDGDLAKLAIAIRDPGMRLSLSKVFDQSMHDLHKRAKRVNTLAQDFERILRSDMKLLESEFSLKLSVPASPDMQALIDDVDMLQKRHEGFFGINQALRLRRAQYAEQMLRTLLTRVRSVFDEAFDMLNMWSSNTYSILVTQVNDMDTAIQNLKSSMMRAQNAEVPLSERISELEKQTKDLDRLQAEFKVQVTALLQCSQGKTEMASWLAKEMAYETAQKQAVSLTSGFEPAAAASSQEAAVLTASAAAPQVEGADAIDSLAGIKQADVGQADVDKTNASSELSGGTVLQEPDFSALELVPINDNDSEHSAGDGGQQAGTDQAQEEDATAFNSMLSALDFSGLEIAPDVQNDSTEADRTVDRQSQGSGGTVKAASGRSDSK